MCILLQLPTGGGKTHVIAAVIAAAARAGLRVLVLVTRTRLTLQVHERLDTFGVPHGVLAAPYPQLVNHAERVQIASVDTLHRRAITDRRMPLPSADIVIFDEAHLAAADTRLNILRSYPSALRIGCTATPARKSGKSIGAVFDHLILGPSIRQLTAAGVLVPVRIYNTPVITRAELQALPKDADNDFATSALGHVFTRPKLIGDVLTNWLRIAPGKRTLCFAVNKAHAAALTIEFCRQGIAAEMLTDADDETAREEVIARLESGATRIIVNCFLMSYGIDIPSVECIILARPTRSLTMYLQQVGRGLRASSGKTECILIDHGHVVETLGLPQFDFGWTLDPKRNVNAETLKVHSRVPTTEGPRTCTECSTLWLTSEEGNCCPSCGWTLPPRARPITVQSADLAEITDDEIRPTPADARVKTFYSEACGWYAQHRADRWAAKPNSGRWWAWVQTRDKFKFGELVMPKSYWELPPFAPSIEVSGWIKHRFIKFAKSKARVV